MRELKGMIESLILGKLEAAIPLIDKLKEVEDSRWVFVETMLGRMFRLTMTSNEYHRPGADTQSLLRNLFQKELSGKTLSEMVQELVSRWDYHTWEGIGE